MKLVINGKSLDVDVPADTPLLWVLREEANLPGTKYGCGRALCGACTVHVDGRTKRSCVAAVGDVVGKDVTTIEGLASGDQLHPVQEAWLAENVVQCGYCQSGQIMSAVALLRAKPDPTDDDIDAALSANLCRCGTYPRIRRAVHRAAKAIRDGAPAGAPPDGQTHASPTRDATSGASATAKGAGSAPSGGSSGKGGSGSGSGGGDGASGNGKSGSGGGDGASGNGKSGSGNGGGSSGKGGGGSGSGSGGGDGSSGKGESGSGGGGGGSTGKGDSGSGGGDGSSGKGKSGSGGSGGGSTGKGKSGSGGSGGGSSGKRRSGSRTGSSGSRPDHREGTP